jgi:hypothetical protein
MGLAAAPPLSEGVLLLALLIAVIVAFVGKDGLFSI